MFPDDDSASEDDATFFARRPNRRYRMMKAPGSPTDGTVHMRVARFAFCRDAQGNRYTASIIVKEKAFEPDSATAAIAKKGTDADIALMWDYGLAEGAELDISPA